MESPAKVKTIKKFLGNNYEVDASGGHVRDLPKSQLGFDAEHDYEPKYITIRGKGDVLAKLRKEVKKADKIYLATDPRRCLHDIAERRLLRFHQTSRCLDISTDWRVCGNLRVVRQRKSPEELRSTWLHIRMN